MNLKEEMIKLSGMKTLVETEVTLTEGVKWFKVSPKIDKLILKVSKQKGDAASKGRLMKALEEAKKDFLKAEEEYSYGFEDKGVSLYKEAKIKHSGVFKMIFKKDTLKFIVTTGLLASVVSLVGIFLSVNNSNNLDNAYHRSFKMWMDKLDKTVIDMKSKNVPAETIEKFYEENKEIIRSKTSEEMWSNKWQRHPTITGAVRKITDNYTDYDKKATFDGNK